MLKRKYIKYISPHNISFFDNRTCTTIISAITFIVLLYNITAPNLIKAIDYQSNVIASRVLNLSLQDATSTQYSYDNIVHITYKDDNTISSINYNTILLNQLKNDITYNSFNQIDNYSASAYIPITQLVGLDWFVNYSPNVKLTIKPVGYVDIRYISEFEAVGINQTLHTIYLDVTADIKTFVPLYSSVTSVSTNMILAQTVIVGQIPENYTNFTPPLYHNTN